MDYKETVTFKHSKEVREAMRLLKAEYKARKKAKLLTSGVGTAKNQTPEADMSPDGGTPK
ncbi:MAG: hypothetical protein ABSF44_15425 [Candidatus Bathyarchaeia archaeon]|jgi:hypothetical protein